MTLKAGAAAKAGHNLTIEVGSWRGTLTVGDGAGDALVAVTADSRSLKVLEGTGGVKSLTDEDRASIKKTIDDEVLKGCAIEFRSTSIAPSADGRTVTVAGELELAGRRNPVSFVLDTHDGRLKGSATVKQTSWGIKPYSALFGTLKVVDEVQVVIDGALPGS